MRVASKILDMHSVTPRLHYFDDFLISDWVAGEGTAQRALGEVHRCLRLLELEQDKHSPAGRARLSGWSVMYHGREGDICISRAGV